MKGKLVHLKSRVKFDNRKQAKLCFGSERFRKMLKTGEIRIIDLANEDETNANEDETEQDLPD